ncbi:MAG: isochorismate synthase, partial [Aggregatilineales bacterium]
LQEDTALAQALLDSKKDCYEHDIVVQTMCERLDALTSEMSIAETRIMQLSNIQHLYSPITASLNKGENVLSVLSKLHPTPALGGSPREIALPLIGGYEPVPRGWYAAPVGWIDANLDGQFVVAIRSAVAQAKRVWMYAGAGIVADSDPQKEWDEIALKFRPMLNAHGIE